MGRVSHSFHLLSALKALYAVWTGTVRGFEPAQT